MNTGLDIEKEKLEQDGSEWTFGAVSQPGLANIPEDEREQYLPKGELQSGKEDFMDCVTRGYLNSLETQFNYLLRNDKLEPENVKWLESKGYIEGGNITFSDRFIAILSGTTRQGNSLKAPIDTIRKQGLIPKSLLPKGDFTWNEYHDPSKITPEMKKLGQDFLKRFSINYEQVPKILMSQSVKDDIVVVAGYAWPRPIDGIYPPSPDLPFNHCFINFKNRYFAFDNYLDDGKPEDWIKHLSEFYEFYTYGYRAYISKETVPTFEDVQDFQRIPLFTWLTNMIAWIFTKNGPMPEIPKEILPEKVEKPVSKLTLWADAITDFESGGNKNSASYKRNNPGNIKRADGTFFVYQTFEAGYAALCNYLIRAATNQHQAYVQEAVRLKKNSSGLLTIKEFIGVYAPDGLEVNKNYSQFIATRCGVTPDTEIRFLL